MKLTLKKAQSDTIMKAIKSLCRSRGYDSGKLYVFAPESLDSAAVLLIDSRLKITDRVSMRVFVSNPSESSEIKIRSSIFDGLGGYCIHLYGQYYDDIGDLCIYFTSDAKAKAVCHQINDFLNDDDITLTFECERYGVLSPAVNVVHDPRGEGQILIFDSDRTPKQPKVKYFDLSLPDRHFCNPEDEAKWLNKKLQYAKKRLIQYDKLILHTQRGFLDRKREYQSFRKHGEFDLCVYSVGNEVDAINATTDKTIKAGYETGGYYIPKYFYEVIFRYQITERYIGEIKERILDQWL